MNDILPEAGKKPEKIKEGKSAQNIKIYLLCAVAVILGFFATKTLFNSILKFQNNIFSFNKPKLFLKIKKIILAEKTSDQFDLGYKPSPAFFLTKIFSGKRATLNKAKPQNFILNGILFSPGKSFALINNKIVAEGDKIGDAAVVLIKEDYVEMKDNSSSFKLTPSIR